MNRFLISNWFLASFFGGTALLMFSSNGLTAPKNTEIRGECTSMSLNDSRTNSIEINGIRFQAIVAKPTWVFDKHAALVPEQHVFPIPMKSSEIPQIQTMIVLHITNVSKKPVYFNQFFSVKSILITPSGQIAKAGGPDSSFSNDDDNFLIMPGDSFNILNGLTIYRKENTISMLLATNQATFFFDSPAEVGIYNFQLTYDNTFTEASNVVEGKLAGSSTSNLHPNHWKGKVTLPPTRFCFTKSSNQK